MLFNYFARTAGRDRMFAWGLKELQREKTRLPHTFDNSYTWGH